ncbi:MAG: OadG family protein [Pseudomonadota bacterium]
MTQGLELMLYGMGSVLVFLSLLVVLTRLMSALVGQTSTELSATEPQATPANREVDPRTLAAITAAIHLHRRSSES